MTTREVLTANRPWMRPVDALIVVEVVSPGTVNIDRVLKVHEYQVAGIPAYLVVDLEQHQLVGFSLEGSGTYVSQVGDLVGLRVAGTSVLIGWADIEIL